MLGTGSASASRLQCTDCLWQVWIVDKMRKFTKGFNKELGILHNVAVLISLLCFYFSFLKNYRNVLIHWHITNSNFSLNKKYSWPLSFVTLFSVICYIFFFFSMFLYYKHITNITLYNYSPLFVDLYFFMVKIYKAGIMFAFLLCNTFYMKTGTGHAIFVKHPRE